MTDAPELEHLAIQVAIDVRAGSEAVWRACTDLVGLEAWHGHPEVFEPWAGGRVLFRNPGWPDVRGVVERVEPVRLLSWRVVDDGSLITEELGETSSGTRMSVTHLPDARDAAWSSRVPSIELGWRESLADLALYVERGVAPRRHMARRTSLGALTHDTPAGVEIGQVEPSGFAARAGMEMGDLLIAVGRAPVFTRSDLALLLREHLPGSEWDVSYVRDGAIRTKLVRL